MAGESALASPPQTEGDLHKALNFAQDDDNNESDNFLCLPIIDDLRQANLLSQLLQQRWAWVGGDKVWGKEGTEGWVRERCAEHASCLLITSFSLIAQQSHAISSIRRACRVLRRLRPRLPSPQKRNHPPVLPAQTRQSVTQKYLATLAGTAGFCLQRLQPEVRQVAAPQRGGFQQNAHSHLPQGQKT